MPSTLNPLNLICPFYRRKPELVVLTDSIKQAMLDFIDEGSQQPSLPVNLSFFEAREFLKRSHPEIDLIEEQNLLAQYLCLISSESAPKISKGDLEDLEDQVMAVLGEQRYRMAEEAEVPPVDQISLLDERGPFVATSFEGLDFYLLLSTSKGFEGWEARSSIVAAQGDPVGHALDDRPTADLALLRCRRVRIPSVSQLSRIRIRHDSRESLCSHHSEFNSCIDTGGS